MSAARRLAPGPALVALALALAAVVLGAAASGPLDVPWRRLPELWAGAPGGADHLPYEVLVNVRLPRVLFSGIAGAALAVAGVAMQALFRNPLAEPGLVGISSGAALGAVFAIVMTAGGFPLIAGAAFLGAVGATFLAYSVGSRHPGVAGLLLAGVAINAIAFSAIGLLTYRANDAQLRDLTFWSMGSLAAADWRMVTVLGPWILVLLAFLCSQWRVLNALLLGEREAAHVGFPLAAVRRRLIVVTALIVGPLVAVTGGIGFVGLVVPHLVRMVLGAHHRALLPASVLTGAIILTLADWMSRVVIAPAELPIGLVTSLVGGPFFFWLLTRMRTLRI